MPCDHPLKGYRANTVNPSGKRSIVFNAREGFYDLPIDLPCGRCDGCKLERSRQWAVRCLVESQQYMHNCFITLTYDEKNLPPDGSLHVDHFQNFFKRLREKVNNNPCQFKKDEGNIRYFHCGEYGEKHLRPHYHACIFNLDFADKKLWKRERENPIFTSATLEELWPYGFSTIGAVTFESAAYVARYIMKKRHGAPKEFLYEGKKEEYVTMSRRPGIGRAFYEKYKKEIFRDDFLIIRGVKMKPPKFFTNQFELDAPGEFAKLKAARQLQAENNKAKNSVDRVKARVFIRKQKTQTLKRSFEGE